MEAEWGDTQDNAIKYLKEALTSHPVLKQPDFKKPWIVASDASNYGIGAVISQEHEGKLCPVAYCSRLLRGAELNYSVQEKECLGLIFGIEKFKNYLTYCPAFQIRLMTDHHSLQFLNNQKLITAGRMARWALKLAEYNATVYYVKGRTNYTGDCLSRLLSMKDSDFDKTDSLMALSAESQLLISRYLPTNGWSLGQNVENHDTNRTLSEFIKKASLEALKSDKYHFCDLNIAHPHEHALFSFARTRPKTNISINRDDYTKCTDFKHVYKMLHPDLDISAKDLKTVKNREKDFFLEGDLLYFLSGQGEVLCIPSKCTHNKTSSDTKTTLRQTLIAELHVTNMAGHRGIGATKNALRNRYYCQNNT